MGIVGLISGNANISLSAGDGEQGREMRTLIQVDYQGNVTLLTQVRGWQKGAYKASLFRGST